MASRRPHVVVVGAGFGGLFAAHALSRLPVEVTVVDRKNHHVFQPLLYQVAMAVLSPAEIASPIRSVLSRRRNVRVLLGEVVGFDLQRRRVRLREGETDLPYDYLIVAAGAGHAYFGHDEWAQSAPGLKTIEDALEIRRRVLLVFEEAERRAATGAASAPLVFVIVGAGPTGVELAGAISDIARRVMVRDFRAIDPKQARVVLLEGGSRVLSAFSENLSASARRQLEEMGVEVRTSTMVTGVEPGGVRLRSRTPDGREVEEFLPAAVTLWAAGVAASPLGRRLGVPTDAAGRVFVAPDASIPGHPEVFVIGDLAHAKGEDGRPLPGVVQTAIQMGVFAARQIGRDLRGRPRETFHYVDKGIMATIGKSRAIAQVWGLELSGFIAWIFWLFVHILFLIGFRNRLVVMWDWAWAYVRHRSSARLITGR
jgi:NADH dehydrogenase